MSDGLGRLGMTTTMEAVAGTTHWVTKRHASEPIRVYVWEKCLASREGAFAGTVLLIHGSSMAGTPTFYLQVPGAGETYSLMDYLARLNYDVWCFDWEGYGRSDKSRDSKFFVADGVDDAEAVAEYIRERRGDGPLLVYGVSS